MLQTFIKQCFYNIFIKIRLQFPYLILDLILGASRATFGFVLAPQRPPGRPKTPPNDAKMLQNGGSKLVKIEKVEISKNTHFSSVFLMKIDALNTRKCTSSTSFKDFRVLKIDIDLRYVVLDAF